MFAVDEYSYYRVELINFSENLILTFLEYHDPAQSLLGEMPSKLLLDTAEDIL